MNLENQRQIDSSRQNELLTASMPAAFTFGIPNLADWQMTLERRDGVTRHISPLLRETALAVLKAANQALLDHFAAMENPEACRETVQRIGRHLEAAAALPGRILAQFSYDKGQGDVVTVTDMFLHYHLIEALKKVVDAPVLSEEGKHIVDPHQQKNCWVLDPLDATMSYIFGDHKYCGPMVAYMENGEPRLSVILNRTGTRMALSERGCGACRLEYSHAVGSICCVFPSLGHTQFSRLKDARVILNPHKLAAHSHPDFQRLAAKLRQGTVCKAVEQPLPSSHRALELDYTRLAAVIHDNSAEHPKQAIWDVVPVQLWVEEAGGTFLGLDGKRYDPRRPMPIVAASDDRTAKELLELLEG